MAGGLSAANAHDSLLLEAVVDAVPAVKGPRGRHRYVVERSLAWLVGYRRLQVHYERRADVLLVFLLLAGALVCRRSPRQPTDRQRYS